MKYLLTVFAIACIFNLGKAQTNTAYDQFLQTFLTNVRSLKSIEDKDLENRPEGTPYLYNKWLNADLSINYNDNKSTQNLKVLIDMELNQINVRLLNNQLGVVPLKYVDTLEISPNIGVKHTYIIYPISLIEGKKEEKLSLYQTFESEKVSFLKRTQKVFSRAKIDGYGNSSAIDEYSELYRYYVCEKGKDKYTKVKLNKKSLQKALPRYKNKIDSLAKKMETNFKSEDEVAKLLASL